MQHQGNLDPAEYGIDTAKYQRSPLRYPGGKFWQRKAILPHILEHMGWGDTLVSPFLGGGWVELAVAQHGARVKGYDAWPELVAFWQTALADPGALADYPVLRGVQGDRMTKARFNRLQLEYQHAPKGTPGIPYLFWVLNRCSFSGQPLGSGLSQLRRLTPGILKRMRDFKAPELQVECLPWQETLQRHPEELMYLDPPYLMENEAANRLYGNRGEWHKGFDHLALWDALRSRPNWIMSYGDNPRIRELYAEHRVLFSEYFYGMTNPGKAMPKTMGGELLIFAKDFTKPSENLRAK